ncbi:hypothetical protein POV26_01540 [Aequorivita todarodis]|uniref:hypothetical protein n=1 Tax=Aequorivita todarodis TaxID=2036821 RepID=UPI0023505DE2|nr:hypothetical protein [Aequorivita todarodis]MDC7999708.1 hypothetical protein [Aequorivita todarodis]
MQFLKAVNNGIAFEYHFEGNEPDKIKEVSDEFFFRKGFKNLGHFGNKTSYEKGSRIQRILFGAFVSYHKHELLYLVSENKLTVKLLNGSSGMSGGLIGMKAVKAEFNRTAENLEVFYQTEVK